MKMYSLIQEDHINNQIDILGKYNKYDGLYEIEALAIEYIKSKHGDISIKFYNYK